MWILLACDTLSFPQCAYLQMVVFRLQWSRLTCCISGKQPCVCSQLQKQSVFSILLKLCWSCRQYLGNKVSVPYVTSIKADFFASFFVLLTFTIIPSKEHKVKHDLFLLLGSSQTDWRLGFLLVKWILFILNGTFKSSWRGLVSVSENMLLQNKPPKISAKHRWAS